MKLKEEYKKSWEYIKKNRRYIYFALILYFVVLIIGLYQPFYKEGATQIINNIPEPTGESLSLEIFFTNLKISAIDLVLGIILGIAPIIILIINGYIIGFGIVEVGLLNHPLVFLFFILIGILELSMIFLSAGLGVRVGMFVFKKNKLDDLKDCFYNNLRVWLLIIAPGLLIAACVESFLINL